MRYQQALRAARLCRTAKRPMMMWGAPGLGKTSLFRKIAADDGVSFRVLELYQHEPTDIRGMGIPDMKKKLVEWLDCGILPRKDRDGENGILLVDDLPAAPTLMQTITYPLILEGRVGDYHLPKGWWAAAAGNRAKDKGSYHAMPPALRSRWGTQVELEAHIDDWSYWALGDNVHPMVIGFVRWRPELLHDYDPKAQAYPCPRSWEHCSDLIHAGVDQERDIMMDMLHGCVGEGAAKELAGFIEVYQDLPNPDAVLMNPDKAEIPPESKPAVRYAICSALAHKANVKNIGAVIEYTERIGSEFATMAVRDAVRKNEAIQHTAEFTQWNIKRSAA